MVIRTGYPENSALIDREISRLLAPDRETLLQATFAPLAGAAKLDFAPASGPFKEFRGSAIVAMAGDRAPFATGGLKLVGPTGYKLVRVDVDTHTVKDFVRNTDPRPGTVSKTPAALERPIDVKFGPDGSMYILDFGELRMKGGHERVTPASGRLFRLVAVPTDASK
jgi:glucose/arabinose dehydrogenase